ncbi:MAG: zinc-ribbon domain-containing protein [Succinivibrionaceae bacterium]|nr:zinc-ribbon domain-containing protein [Succinivibrionaceae bacterium]
MICGNCGAQVPDNTNFCTHCGARLAPVASQDHENSGSSQDDQTSLSQSGHQGQYPQSQSQPGQQGQYPLSGSYQSQPAFRQTRAAQDPELTGCINSLNTMNVLQIITLVLMFLPVVNMAGFVMLLVILVMSLSLTSRVRNVFERAGNQAYADLVARIRGMCKFILGYSVGSFIFVFAMMVMSAAVSDPAGLMEDSQQTVMAIAVLGLFALFVVASVYAFFAEIYCFIRLYHVRGALLQLSAGNALPAQVPSSGCLIAAIIGVVLLALVAVVGIVASIMLPAYAKYQARAKFAEVVSATYPLKQQVELCIFDVGPEEAATYCSTGKKANVSLGQRGWDLSKPAGAYATKYVSSITVDGGVITATGHVVGNIPETIVLVPQADNSGHVDWTVSPQSSCIRNDLC